MASDRLSELASSSALLKAALTELRGEGISDATADALVSSEVADVELSEFLNMAAREVSGNPQKLYGLAISLPAYIDQRGVGHEALDFCLNSGQLNAKQMISVGFQMRNVTTEAAVRWCHSRLTSVIKSDPNYGSFLVRHIDTVVRKCYDDMAAYLLHPNRGPGRLNLDSFELVVSRVDNPMPFQRRWIEWIYNGYFDQERKEGSEEARELYVHLNSHWGEARFVDIVEAIEAHVHSLLESNSQDRLRGSMYHLAAMVRAKYRGVSDILNHMVTPVYDFGPEDRRMLALLREALEAVVAYNLKPSDKTREVLVDEHILRIVRENRIGIIRI